MAKVSLTSTPSGGQNDAPLSPPVAGIDTSRVFPGLGSIDSVRSEIDDAFADMRQFHNQEPDEIMRLCGGHSARLSEIKVRIQRIEDFNRQWRPIRTREVEPTLEELQQQFTIASRLHSVRELDYKMTQGAP